jgi:hypothetical protein
LKNYRSAPRNPTIYQLTLEARKLKVLKMMLALALASQLLLACSKDTNTNANNTNNSNTTKTSTTTTNTTTTNTSKSTNANAEATAPQTATDASGDNIFKHEEGGIQFERPAGWKAEPNGEQLTLSTPDNALSVVLWVPAEANFQQAAEALDKELSKTITNVKENGEPRQTTVGGMKTVSLNGTGEVNGAEIQWAVDLIQAKKPVIVLTFAAPGMWEKYQGDYQKFARSIRPIG